MSKHIHDTPQIEQMQRGTLESDLWNTEVVPRLPSDLEVIVLPLLMIAFGSVEIVHRRQAHRQGASGRAKQSP